MSIRLAELVVHDLHLVRAGIAVDAVDTTPQAHPAQSGLDHDRWQVLLARTESDLSSHHLERARRMVVPQIAEVPLQHGYGAAQDRAPDFGVAAIDSLDVGMLRRPSQGVLDPRALGRHGYRRTAEIFERDVDGASDCRGLRFER